MSAVTEYELDLPYWEMKLQEHCHNSLTVVCAMYPLDTARKITRAAEAIKDAGSGMLGAKRWLCMPALGGCHRVLFGFPCSLRCVHTTETRRLGAMTVGRASRQNRGG